jgi:glycosyltransferase involved in cell wall biosynthesis
LAHEGVEVDVYHGGPEGAASPFSAAAQPLIMEHCIPFPSAVAWPGHYLYESYQFSKAVGKRLLAQLSGVDLIYAQGYTAWWLLAQPASLRQGVPVCVNFHGLEPFQASFDPKGHLQQWLLRQPLRQQVRRADYVQSLGGKLTGILKRIGVAPRRIWELPIGLDDSWLEPRRRPSHDVRRLVFVGRYERRKGIPELHAALQTLDPRQFRMDFIGPIPEEKRLKGEHLRYWGLLRDPIQIQQILQQADVLVSPSHAEGMPTVIMEAMAAGCAILATDVGAVAEQVDETNGWLIAPGDQAQLCRQLQHLLSIESSRLAEMQAASQRRIEARFLWPKVARQMLDTFQQSLQP